MLLGVSQRGIPSHQVGSSAMSAMYLNIARRQQVRGDSNSHIAPNRIWTRWNSSAMPRLR